MIIYLVTNILNGKRYVGQTTRTLEQRIKEHQQTNSGVGKAINEYGMGSLRFEILERCNSIEQPDDNNFICQHRNKPIISTKSIGNTMTIAESLKHFRKQHRLTQQQVADVLGLTRQAYLSYEYNGIPPSSSIVKIAKAFNVSADYLLGLSDKPLTPVITDADYKLIEVAIAYRNALKAVTDERCVNNNQTD